MRVIDGEPTAARSTRLALVACGLLVLLAVVAFASRSGFGHRSSTAATPAYVNYAFSAFLIVFVLAIPVSAYAFLIQARQASATRKSLRSRLLANIVTAAVFAILAFVVIYVKLHHGHILNIDTSALKRSRDALTNRNRRAAGTTAPTFEWTVLWVALAALTVGAGLLVHRRRQRHRLTTDQSLEGDDVADELATSMTDAIDDLEAEPDARRAVIAAYARMEAVLGRNGLRRRPSETPPEYLRRILLGLTDRADAVARLTQLFEQAKFSHHEIDRSMKQDAIGALREIRDDLRARAAA